MGLGSILHEIANIGKKIVKFSRKELAAIEKNLIKVTERTPVAQFFKDIRLGIKDGECFLNTTKFGTFFKEFKIGRIDSAMSMLNKNIKLSADAVSMLKNEARSFPEFSLSKIEKLSQEFKTLKNTPKAVAEAAKSQSKIGSAIRSLGKRIKAGKVFGYSLAITVTGLTAYGLIEEYRKLMTGCFRYETQPNGSMRTCKVSNLSCNSFDKQKVMNFCTDKDLFPSQKAITCAENDKNTPCRICDSNITDPKHPNYIPERANIPQNVLFKCVNPTFWDACGDVVTTPGKIVGGAVDNIVTTGTNISKYAMYGFAIIIGIGLFVFIFKIFGAFVSDRKKDKQEDDYYRQLDRQYIKQQRPQKRLEQQRPQQQFPQEQTRQQFSQLSQQPFSQQQQLFSQPPQQQQFL